jgi:drug/metabolite transporter (DMT)-like permease
MRLKADLVLFLVAVMWGSCFAAQRVAGQLGSVYYFNGFRYLLAGAVVLLFFFLRRRGNANSSMNGILPGQYRWMLIAGVLLASAAALQQAGVLYTTAGNAGFITGLYVVLVPIVLFFGWRDRLRWQSVACAVLAAAGAFLLSTGGSFRFHKGDALELAGAFLWALHVIVVGKFGSRYSALSFSAGQLIMCGVLNSLAAVLFEDFVFTPSLAAAIVYTAVMGAGLGFTLQVWAQKHTPPTDAALIMSLEAVFAVIAGWLYLGERLATVQMIGCGIILAAIGLSQAANLRWGAVRVDGAATAPNPCSERDGGAY